MNTREPMPTRLRQISSQLFRVALLTVTPHRSTGSTWATGVSFPVRPTSQVTLSMVVVASSAANL